MGDAPPDGGQGALELLIFDTSPLIFLDSLGHIPLLQELYEVLIPPAAAELVVQPGQPGNEVPQLPWIQQRIPDPVHLERVTRELNAGRGEREAITLAIELSTRVVLDDRRARAYARQMGVEITGALGVLLAIHRAGIAPRDLETDVSTLEEGGMRLAPQVRQAIFEEARRNASF